MFIQKKVEVSKKKIDFFSGTGATKSYRIYMNSKAGNSVKDM
jgi:hypothetical protein